MENEGGRPPIFETPTEFEQKVNQYFIDGLTIKEVVIGKGDSAQVVKVPVPTTTGLALYCGFESRQSLYDYGKRDGFSYIVKKARTFIEKHYEELLQIGNTTGAIFALKNMGWIDAVHNDLTTKGESLNRPLSPEEIAKRNTDIDNEL